jgi:polar amino acid transport system substrate-binding protein
MKKIIITILAVVLAVSCVCCFTACNKNEGEIVVYTNAFFAPFEYYDGTEIVGVDIDIMNKVGKNMGKTVKFEDKDFSVLIDAVSEGKLCDCAAAGITITDERKEKVNFSTPYYTSMQYVIYKNGTFSTVTATDGTTCVYWNALGGKKIGVQLDTTGDIYVGIEIDGDKDYVGAIQNTNAVKTQYESAQLAYESLKAGTIDVVVVDELPAEYLIKNDKADYSCMPLYYDGGDGDDAATSEQYAIAVNKDQTELLDAINSVLDGMLADVDENGNNAIQLLVMKHFGVQ